MIQILARAHVCVCVCVCVCVRDTKYICDIIINKIAYK